MNEGNTRCTHLIVGGTTKAGTTSVFNYLRDHPSVCGSSLKELRFFLDPDYPVPAPHSYVDEGIEGYGRYFSHCPDKPVRLEATPDYLYSPTTPEVLRRALDDPRCVFILRNPIDRVASWYRFAVQNAQVDRSVTFETFVQRQLSREDRSPSQIDPDKRGGLSWQPWHAVEQGRYSRYVRHYIETMGQDRVLVVFFENMTQDTQYFVKKITKFAGIDPTFFDTYSFDVYNSTRFYKYPRLHALYRWVMRAVRRHVHTWPVAHDILRRIRSWVDPAYKKIFSNRSKNIPTKLKLETKKLLKEYYKKDIKILVKLIDQDPPWRFN